MMNNTPALGVTYIPTYLFVPTKDAMLTTLFPLTDGRTEFRTLKLVC